MIRPTAAGHIVSVRRGVQGPARRDVRYREVQPLSRLLSGLIIAGEVIKDLTVR